MEATLLDRGTMREDRGSRSEIVHCASNIAPRGQRFEIDVRASCIAHRASQFEVRDLIFVHRASRIAHRGVLR